MTRATARLAPRFVLFIVVATGAAAATVIYTCCLFYANLMQHPHSLTLALTLTHTHTLPQGKENKRAAI